ncbi:uncharacterized protein LOC116847621 [Odontomachus brunneus]|uniref:uncharacterized protein LOC116847621 n=1 Tax=Odontomachus brunneus TaxID=486640 RepID=UPI0013F186F0|nr:uncharacterized protein LOC116847621 [Odontomachus brunneus]
MDDWIKNFSFVVEYCGRCKPEYYNKFFHPNVCHVCKTTKSGDLIPCNKCRMIFYCNNEHRREHASHHMELCQYLTQFLKEKEDWGNTRYALTSEWTQSRKEFLHTIKTRLLRKLKPYEEEMIIFAKSCVHCHQQINLNTCQTCYSDNYCIGHLQEFKSQHESKCKMLMLCLNLDIRYLSFNSFENKFSSFNAKSPVGDMKTFILQFVRCPTEKNIERLLRDDYYYSDYVSGPLTLCYGMKDAGLLDFSIKEHTYIIHVIAANHLDLLYVKAWELFLHCLRYVKKLTILLIGPELENRNRNIKLCYLCTSRRRTLCFESYSMSYIQYMNSASYTRPNVIMGIHADFNNWKTWPTSILKSQINTCPWLLTTKSEDKAKLNMHVIEEVLGESVRSVCTKNKFASIRPWRDVETGYVSYRNEYITIYNYLEALEKP